MAWYPGATKMELQPESDSQPTIRPTQMIVHSIVAPWAPRRTYEYWRDSTSLESHFGLGYDGDVAQYIGTETRADANAGANRRPDGTGAVSVETASNTKASDVWTPEQIEKLIRLGVWLHQRHGIPLRICRSHSDPGYGYHSLYAQWSTSGTACPGPARIKQFREVVFPGIVARATNTPMEDDVALTDADKDDIAARVVAKLLAGGGALESSDLTRIWGADIIPAPRPPYNNPDYFPTDGKPGNTSWSVKYAQQAQVEGIREAVARLKDIQSTLGAIGGGGLADQVKAELGSLKLGITVSDS